MSNCIFRQLKGVYQKNKTIFVISIKFKSNEKYFLIIGISLFFNGSLYAQSDDWSPKDHNLIKSVREDGRFLSSYGVVHAMLRNTEPRYAFHSDFSPKEFRKWQKGLRHAMEK